MIVQGLIVLDNIILDPDEVRVLPHHYFHITTVKRYNELGISGIGDHRSQNQGAKPLMGDVEQAQLWQALQENAPDGGFWNGRKVADWLSEVTGIHISRQRGWEILRQMTFRLRVPRPSHSQSDPFEQEAWKKN